MTNVRVAHIEPVTRAEGPGMRWALWVQGCSIRCPDCCNPHTWDPAAGSTTAVDDLIRQMLATPVEGITLLGGEPFEQAETLAELARAARAADRGVMTFTGYRYEVLRRSDNRSWAALLNATDLLVDGPFLRDRLDQTRPWVGSTNQRFFHLTGRYRDMPLSVGGDRVEIRVRRDGVVAINGWPDSALIQSLEELLDEVRDP